MAQKSKPINEKDVQKSPDAHIDQDFPGFPHLPADKKSITPQTETEKKLAGTNKKRTKKVYGN